METDIGSQRPGAPITEDLDAGWTEPHTRRDEPADPLPRPDDPLPLTTERVEMERLDGRDCGPRHDLVAVEEPLELRVNDRDLGITMRTPGADEELLAGLLASEGVISARRDLVSAGLSADLRANVVEARLAPHVEWDPGRFERRFYASSACGVCGRAALEAVAREGQLLPGGVTIDREVVTAMPRRLRAGQSAFARTGGLHAAGLFDIEGRALVVREDVGRHNALDKVIGWALLADRLPLREVLVCVSGRLSFELVQKTVVAGAPLLAGVSAPTSLAVDLARDRRLTLCGFVRGSRINVYSAPERLGE